jgi:hypothetical protein
MKQIKNIVAALSHGFTYGPELRPVRDWVYLFGFGIVLFFLSTISGLWMFSKVTNSEAIGSVATTTSAIEQEYSIDEISRVFEIRKEESLRYLKEYTFVDPKTQSR